MTPASTSDARKRAAEAKGAVVSGDRGIVAALADHHYRPFRDVQRCTCGWTAVGFACLYDEHLAAVIEPLIVARQRAAWDEAIQALSWAMDNGSDPLGYVRDNNPFRVST